MNYKNYPKIIAENDTYSTPENRSKKIINPSFSYYWRLIRIVLKSNFKVKQKIYNRYNWQASSVDVLEALEDVGVRFEIKGMHYLNKVDGPVMFIANHMSTLETMVLPSIIQPLKNVVYVIKEELTKYPLFGPVAAARHPICVGRENPREDLKIVMEEGARRITDGRSIIIFPQTTRSLNLNKKKFNTLGVKMAKRFGVPVIPIALISDAWGNGKLIKDFGKIDPTKTVHIEFGEPVSVSGNGNEQHQYVVNFIASKFKEWGRENYIIDK